VWVFFSYIFIAKISSPREFYNFMFVIAWSSSRTFHLNTGEKIYTNKIYNFHFYNFVFNSFVLCYDYYDANLYWGAWFGSNFHFSVFFFFNIYFCLKYWFIYHKYFCFCRENQHKVLVGFCSAIAIESSNERGVLRLCAWVG